MTKFIQVLFLLLVACGVAYGGYWYYEAYYVNNGEISVQDVIDTFKQDAIDDFWKRFPESTDLVMELDMSAMNQSALNYGLIKERYPFLQTLEDQARNMPELNEPYNDEISHTQMDLWNSLDKSFFLVVEFNEEDPVQSDFYFTAGLKDPMILRDIFTKDVSLNAIEMSNSTFKVEAETEDYNRTLYVQILDDLLTVSTKEDLYATPLENNIGKNAYFASVWYELDENALGKLYFDGTGYRSLIKLIAESGTDTEEEVDMGDLMTLYDYMDAFGYSLVIGIDELYIESVAMTHETEFMPLSDFENRTFEEFNAILPEETLLMISMNKPANYVAMLMKSFDTMAPEFSTQMSAMETEINERYGVDIVDTLTTLFGDDMAFAMTESADPVIPVSFIVLSKLGEDTEKTDTALKGLETVIEQFVNDELYFPDETANIAFVEGETEGYTYRKFLPNPRVQFGIHYSTDLTPNMLIMSSATYGLESVFNTANKTAGNIGKNERYKEAVERVQPKEYNQFVFVDLNRIYQLLKPFVSLGLPEDQFLNFEENVDPYLQKLHSIYGYSVVGEDSMHSRFGIIFE